MLKPNSKAKMLGQFFTKQTIASLMASLFVGDMPNMRILEPCFGKGAFLQALKNRGCQHIVGCELDAELYTEGCARFSEFDLHCGDFLQFSCDELFDGIIMNPPYIRHENIDLLASYGVTKERLRTQSEYQGLPSQANLYMYFIVHAFNLLKEGGELVAIFPKSWTNSLGGKYFQSILNTNGKLKEKIIVHENAFEQDAMVDVVIFKWEKNTAFPSDFKLNSPDNFFLTRLFRCESVAPFSGGVPFRRYARVRRGMSTGYNKLFVNPLTTSLEQEKSLIPIISSPKAIKGYSTRDALCDRLLLLPAQPAQNTKCEEMMLPEGIWKDYFQEAGRQILQEKKPLTLLRRIQHQECWYTLTPMDCNGFIFSYFVRQNMRFIHNSEAYLVRDNFYIIYPEINSWVLFSLLNNYYTYYQLEKQGRVYGAGLLKIQKYDIDNLVFPDLDVMPKDIISLLEENGKYLADTGDASFVEKITCILSDYFNNTSFDIFEEYNKIKTHRLDKYYVS